MNRVSRAVLLPLLLLWAFEAASQDYIVFTNFARVGTNFQFQLVTTNNSTCDIQYADRLNSPISWTNLFSVTGNTNISLPMDGPMRFFRAQSSNDFSVNAIGYVHLTIPVGFTMIANPLVASGTNTLSSVIPSPPLFSNFLQWNGSSFDVATFTPGGWDNDYGLVPGHGGFLNTDTAFTNVFLGEVWRGYSFCWPPGYSIWSALVPQAGGVDAIGLSRLLGTFDNVLIWTNSPPGYGVYTLLFGGAWDPAEPQLGVGQSVFINSQSGGCFPPCDFGCAIESLLP